MKGNFIILLIVMSTLLMSCGTTQLVVNNSDVDIYINGAKSGKGTATMTRSGPPKSVKVEAKYDGVLVGSKIVKRRFTGVTCLVGYLTYGIGLFTAWQYPETVVIPIKDISSIKTGSCWDNTQNSAWKKPLYKSK